MNQPDHAQGISQLLEQVRDGDGAARDEVFRRVNDQLRTLARGLMRSERPDHTLQPTALVNEACAKLIRGGGIESAESRQHLFRAAVAAMHQVLIDHARRRRAQKRGGEVSRLPLDLVLDQVEHQYGTPFEELDEALDRLKRQSPRQHEVLTLRFFGGLSIAAVADLLQCSHGTVENDWRLARAKLYSWLRTES